MTPVALALGLVGAALAGPLRIDVVGDPMRSVELACLDGFRVRQTLAPPTPGAPLRAVFPDAAHDRCTLHFKGASPARWGPVPADAAALTCTVSGTHARCAAPQPIDPAPRADAAAPTTRPPVAAVPSPPPAPPTGQPGQPGELLVALADAPGVYGFELNCRGGHRARANRAGRFANVPDDECRLQFRGSPPAIVHKVSPGTRLDCHLNGVTAVCTATPFAP